MSRFSLAFALAVLLTCGAAIAQEVPDRPVSELEKRTLVDSLAARLLESYVFPETAAGAAGAIKAKEAAGGYAPESSAAELASAVTADIRKYTKDAHLVVGFDPRVTLPPPGKPSPPTPEQREHDRRATAQWGYGIGRIERLAGNVGYLEVTNFGDPAHVAEAYEVAVLLLDGTAAMIIDLRKNSGGHPGGVAALLSHFVELGEKRHLNSIYTRPTNSTEEFWTNPAVKTRYAKPLYVLQSKETFSAGEEFAYDLRVQQRGTLIGETTAGGANPGDGFPLGNGFLAFVPTGRAINPVTGTNWEGTGVRPDIQAPAGEALRVAHAAVLESMARATADPQKRQELQAILQALHTELKESEAVR